MPISELIRQSLIIMVVGLSIVFLFLIILIISVNLSHAIIHKFGLDIEDKPENKGSSSGDDQNIPVVIGAAVSRFRAEKK